MQCGRLYFNFWVLVKILILVVAAEGKGYANGNDQGIALHKSGSMRLLNSYSAC